MIKTNKNEDSERISFKNDNLYFSVKDIAGMLNVQERTVSLWCRTKKIKASKLSHKNWRVKKEDLQKFIDENFEKTEKKEEDEKKEG